jgi:phosphohistidine phosphatase
MGVMEGMAIERHLYLLRHAKSSWDDAKLADHERPLAPRGKKAMKAMARHLRREGIHPQRVLCSSAKRARQTLERIIPALGNDVALEVEDALYTFDDEPLFVRLKRVPASVTSLMLVGHNPALQDLTLRLAGSGEAIDRVAAKFPTGALAVLSIPVAWSRLRPGVAQLVAFVSPSDV